MKQNVRDAFIAAYAGNNSRTQITDTFQSSPLIAEGRYYWRFEESAWAGAAFQSIWISRCSGMTARVVVSFVCGEW